MVSQPPAQRLGLAETAAIIGVVLFVLGTHIQIERDPSAFRFDDAGVEWRRRRLQLDAIRRSRESGIVSFGSCSFTEPIGDLESLGLL